MQPILLYYHRTLILLTIVLPFVLIPISTNLVCAQPAFQSEIITARQGLPQAFVPAILQDHQGFIWMATRDGLCRYDGNHFNVFQPSTNEKPGVSSSGIHHLSLDKQGKIWIITNHSDIDVMDPMTETFINFSKQPFFKRHFENDLIDAHYMDRQGNLWLSFFSNKLVRIDPVSKQIKQFNWPFTGSYSPIEPTFGGFVQDLQGTIWMSTKDGLTRLDSHTGRFSRYSLPENDIKALSVRQNGDLLLLTSRSLIVLKPQTGHTQLFPLPVPLAPRLGWFHADIISDNQGNDYFSYYNLLFHFNEKQGVVFDQTIGKFQIQSLFVDRSNVLWIGTSAEGLYKINLNTNTFKTLPTQTEFYRDLLIHEFGIPASQVPVLSSGYWSYNFRYTLDPSGQLWFNLGSNQIYQLDIKHKKLAQVPFELPPQRKWINNRVPMATDPAGRIWIINNSQPMWYEGNRWNQFPYPIQSTTPVVNPLQDSLMVNGVKGKILQFVVDAQALWLITDLQGLYRIDRANGKIRNYRHQPDNPASISSNQLFCVVAEPLDKNILWIGTFGNGLCRFDKRSGSCRRFSTHDGLPNNVIYAAIPDQQQSIWIATNQGICQMNRTTFQTHTYTHEDGIIQDEFNRFHFVHLLDERIILGGIEGITSFYPRQLRTDTYQPLTQITNIQLNNQPVLPGPLTDSLPIQSIRRLELPYNQNFITIGFAAMQYNRLAKIRYRYQLVGLNQKWIETNQPVAQYTDLRWGHYTLKLNASNTSGIWSKHIRVLTIVIRPPWWATWWAILLYTVGVVVVGYILARSYLNQQEARQLKAIDVMKARFFTNITHEFRTPLTLILGPVETLKQRLHSASDQHQLTLIKRNATQLMELVNQLMDLSKAEANALQVNESQGDIVVFLSELVSSFESQANLKGIQLTFQAEAIGLPCWFDADKLERIVSNLVVNALKFTPIGGKVSIELAVIDAYETIELTSRDPEQESWLQLTVSDNGIGITREEVPFIFDRFYQADSTSIQDSIPDQDDKYEQEGSGIGLALVKELVECQSGTIQVISKIGLGTRFTIELPYRPAATIPTPSLPTTPNSKTPQHLIADEQQADKVPVVLVVEDNAALRTYIADSLPYFYEVYQASNGTEGLAKAITLMPDLIISDVLMPIMDGYQLCQQLKKDPNTSHIPIILLTAKAAVDSRLEGLSYGADDYIAKPFHVQELQLRVRNILEQRRQLREWILASATSLDPLPDTPILTDPLIEKLFQVIDQHLDDTLFGVEELIQHSGLSRMNLHRKLKSLTGTSAGEFIRNYRLKRAAQFLREGQSVSETAYQVGFDDPSYFARSFRKVYQVSPSTFSRTSKQQ